MNLKVSVILCLVAVTLLNSFAAAKKEAAKSKLAPCPDEDAPVCIDCVCNPKKRGVNSCKPSSSCPEPLQSTSGITKKNKTAICPYGETFSAQCILCECSGFGQGDHCAMCFALPVRRGGQPEQVNNELPQNTDNKFTNYEINGWAADGDEEEEEEEEEEVEENEDKKEKEDEE